MITTDIKNKILAAIKVNRANYPSDAKHAASLGITTSVYSAVKNGQIDRVLSDANWISIARKLGVSLRGEIEWKVAKTPTYQFITAQLEACQSSGISAILCDLPNIGKTFTARHYVKTHPNAIYIDCSQVKTKLKLVRKIAAEFGVDSKGRYADVYDDLVYYLGSIDNPLIILDEAGDLQYEAFLELKALWNATERCCAWYMMGADGLKEKINRSIECKKVGYTEMLSRYGDRYSKVTPDDSKAQDAEPDWEQRRYEIAKEVMASMVGAVVNGAIDKGAVYDPNYTSLAKTSIAAATALVDELKKTQEKK